ncbi:MAG TPA: hypothetical protein VMN81_04225 [Vicinamibacterales bacterium]|nr:hypothetical protein [Vicinamibacterales bacterium]
MLLTGCGATPQPAWSNSFDSPEALAAAALEALAAADEPRLARLALSEEELRDTVWPALPASREEVGMPWNYFWRDHAQRNTGYVKTLLATHGGKGYDLAAVSFEGSASYGDVTIHRESALDLRTAAGSQRLRLFGSMAERGGQWKLYSYVVD